MHDVHLALTVLAALWGAAAGALLPRPAHRLSVGTGLPWRDDCPAGHPAAAGVRGWLGPARCPACVAAGPGPDGERHPGALVTPAATALAAAALAAATGPRPELAVWLLLTPPAALLAVVDHRVRRLPDRVTLPLAGTAVLLLGGAGALPGHAGSWPRALLGALALGGFYLVLYLVNPNGIGFGDVKLALALGAVMGWYGWTVLLTGTLAGLLIGSLHGLARSLRDGRGTVIALGPFMIIGTFLAVVLGAAAVAG